MDTGADIGNGNIDAAISFLQQWDARGLWCLSAFDPDTRKQETRTFRFDQLNEAKAFLHWRSGRSNVYFSPNRVERILNKKAEKEDISQAICLHVDIDPPAPNKVRGEDANVIDIAASADDAALELAQFRASAIDRLNAFELRPSVVVNSGGGVQAFWLLADGGVSVSNAANKNGAAERLRVEEINRGLAKIFGGDHCHNIDRIMRLPGTINIPDDKKRKKGRVRAEAFVIWAEWGAKYELSSFDRYRVTDARPSAVIGDDTSLVFHRTDAPDWVYWVIDRGLSNDPNNERGYGGDRSKAVFSVCCALVRCGWTATEISAVLLNRDNAISSHIYDQTDPPSYAQRQAAQAIAKVGEGFEKDGNQIRQSARNVRTMLLRMGVEFSYDAFSSQNFIVGPGEEEHRRVTDIEITKLFYKLGEKYTFQKLKSDWFRGFIEMEAYESRFHPVREYINGLSWDGVPRVDNWLCAYGGVEDSDYSRAVGALVLIAAVRRIKKPGCKFDEMLVLQGAQGVEKSTALRVLAVRDEWFSDSVPLDRDENKLIEALQGRWIIEDSELSGFMGGARAERVKAALTRASDRARLAYAHIGTELPRQCVIIGSTNSDQFLSDPTGNRRVWPVKVRAFDIDKLRADRDQLWAEAAVREAKGESIRLRRELWGVAAIEQEGRIVDDPWSMIIERELGVFNEEGGKILGHELWAMLNIPEGLREQKHQRRLGDAMRKLGWDRKKARIDKKLAWCYVKGPTLSIREERITIVRNENGTVSTRKYGVSNLGGVTEDGVF